MALPSPGSTISMSQVRTELGGSGSQSLSAAGVTLASITAGNEVELSNDLGGTSAGDTISLSWGTTTYITNTSTHKDAYRVVNHSGHTSPQIITINLTWDAYAAPDTYCDIYRSINSTLSWTYVGGVASASTEFGVSFSIANVDYNDVVRVRMDVNNIGFGFFAYMTANITGGSITSGSGTISGSGSWTLTL